MKKLAELTTPALVADRVALEHNLATMAGALPGPRCRPHVKAHKCTGLAAAQARLGHTGFTCATIAEAEGMARAGLGQDLLVANEVSDASRLGRLRAGGARVTLAVDSDVTVAVAARDGVEEVVVDVDVGQHRCGCVPSAAGRLADVARRQGLEVRGVMGYEGHVVGLPDREKRVELVEEAMALLAGAHAEVGGDIVTAGGTGTYDINTQATEIQAGSYALMDTTYGRLGLPFRQALRIEATVISVSASWAVADCGLKALGMDHGNPTVVGGDVRSCSDEHVTFTPGRPVAVGDRVSVLPAHVDPTVAYHATLHLVEGEEVVESWPVDLRGW